MKSMMKFFEIPTKDFSRGVKFYSDLFDIELKDCDCGEDKMAFFPGDEGAVIFAKGFEPSENGVIVSLDAGEVMENKLNKVTKLGGKILMNKCKIQAEGKGYFAIINDTEGNRIGLYSEK